MLTSAGTRWLGVPSPMDALFFPSVTIGDGGVEGDLTLLVSGDSRTYPGPSFLITFGNVESICAYSETLYWSLAAEPTRPQHVLNLILESPLLRRVAERGGNGGVDRLAHFLVCGGDMCCEVLAADCYGLRTFDTAALASEALASIKAGTFKGPACTWFDAPT